MKRIVFGMCGVLLMVLGLCSAGCSDLLVYSVLGSGTAVAGLTALIAAIFNGVTTIKIPGLTAVLLMGIMLSGCSQKYQSGATGADKPGVSFDNGLFSGTHVKFNSDGSAQVQSFGITKNSDGSVSWNLSGLNINQTPSVTDTAEVEKMKVMVELWDKQVLLAHEIRLGVADVAKEIGDMVNVPKGVVDALANLQGKVDLQNKTFEYGSIQVNALSAESATPTPTPAATQPAAK